MRRLLWAAEISFKQSGAGVLENLFEAGESINPFLSSSDFCKIFKPYDIVYVSNRIQRSAMYLLAVNPTMPLLDGLRSNNVSPRELERALFCSLFRSSSAVISAVTERVFPPNEPYVAVHARTGAVVSGGHEDRFNEITQELALTARRLLNCKTSLDPDASKRILHQIHKSSNKSLLNSPNLKVFTFVLTMASSCTLIRARVASIFAPETNCAPLFQMSADAYALGLANALVFLHSGFAYLAIDIGTVQQWHEYNLNFPSHIDQCSVLTTGSQ